MLLLKIQMFLRSSETYVNISALLLVCLSIWNSQQMLTVHPIRQSVCTDKNCLGLLFRYTVNLSLESFEAYLIERPLQLYGVLTTAGQFLADQLTYTAPVLLANSAIGGGSFHTTGWGLRCTTWWQGGSAWSPATSWARPKLWSSSPCWRRTSSWEPSSTMTVSPAVTLKISNTLHCQDWQTQLDSSALSTHMLI